MSSPLPVHLTLRAPEAHPAMPFPALPHAEHVQIGLIDIEPFTHTRTYEVAAWYSTVDIPAQRAPLMLTPQVTTRIPAALSEVDAVVTYEHTPSLYGGVAVGTGGSGACNTPTRHTVNTPLGALRALADQGRVCLSSLGEQWAEFGQLADACDTEARRRRTSFRVAFEQLEQHLKTQGQPFELVSWRSQQNLVHLITPLGDDLSAALSAWQAQHAPCADVQVTDLGAFRAEHLACPLGGVRVQRDPETGGDFLWLRAGTKWQRWPVPA